MPNYKNLDIDKRSFDFGIRIIKLVNALPKILQVLR